MLILRLKAFEKKKTPPHHPGFFAKKRPREIMVNMFSLSNRLYSDVQSEQFNLEVAGGIQKESDFTSWSIEKGKENCNLGI